MSYEYNQKVLFKYCDPDGFVFYPRLVEMINDTVEGFFAEALNWPFEEMLKTSGTPTVRLEIDFAAPAIHGEQLRIALTVEQIGSSSLTLSHRATCNGALRFSARQTLVRITAEPPRKSAPWPDAIRARLESHRKGSP